MQDVAREMNLSETAFLHREGDAFNLRWFTPAVEVELCGHATLASAHILWETGLLAVEDVARFHTQGGLLTAERRGEEIELNFPATPPTEARVPVGLVEALGVVPRYVGKSRYAYVVEVESGEVVRGLKPDFARLKKMSARGIMITSVASSKTYDFVSRFFAPGAGVDEDPVTGSAHCCLGPFWSERLGKDAIVAYQASARGGCNTGSSGGQESALGRMSCHSFARGVGQFLRRLAYPAHTPTKLRMDNMNKTIGPSFLALGFVFLAIGFVQ